MREIKLKFWDKILNCWSGGSHHLITSGKFAWAPEEGNRYIPVQYTGLKDKNGKEIYEGGICEIRFYGKPKVLTQCKWINSLAQFSLMSTDNTPYSISFGGSIVDGVYVIGNIYENPELLK